jgi:hypothetical protein
MHIGEACCSLSVSHRITHPFALLSLTCFLYETCHHRPSLTVPGFLPHNPAKHAQRKHGD